MEHRFMEENSSGFLSLNCLGFYDSISKYVSVRHQYHKTTSHQYLKQGTLIACLEKLEQKNMIVDCRTCQDPVSQHTHWWNDLKFPFVLSSHIQDFTFLPWPPWSKPLCRHLRATTQTSGWLPCLHPCLIRPLLISPTPQSSCPSLFKTYIMASSMC